MLGATRSVRDAAGSHRGELSGTGHSGRLAGMAELTFVSRALDDPLVQGLLEAYVSEIADAIPGFDPSRAAPPDPGDFEAPTGTFLVGFDEGRPLACGGLRRLGPGVGEIRRMWVDASARGRGIGAALLSALEAAARRAGYCEVRLDTNGALTGAISLYRRSGYVEVGRYNDNEFAELFFAKRL